MSLVFQDLERVEAISQKFAYGISVGKFDGDIEIFNAAMSSLIGLKVAEVQRMGWLSFLFPSAEARCLVMKQLESVALRDLRLTGKKVHCRNGEPTTLGFSMEFVFIDVSLYYVVVMKEIYTDIHEQYADEIVESKSVFVKQHENYYKQLLDTLEDLLTDKLGNTVCTIGAQAELASMTENLRHIATTPSLVFDAHRIAIESVALVRKLREMCLGLK